MKHAKYLMIACIFILTQGSSCLIPGLFQAEHNQPLKSDVGSEIDMHIKARGEAAEIIAARVGSALANIEALAELKPENDEELLP